MAMLADRRRALVRGPLSPDETPLILNDAHGPIAISALPFGYEYAAREAFADDTIKSPADVLRAQVSAARPRVPSGSRWIIVAHAFVTGATVSESERPLTRIAGGIETAPADVFDGAHYVALGHIHRPQTAGAPHIRYAGASLPFGFDEEGDVKSMALVELDENGHTTIELIPFQPLRHVRTLHGTLEQILRLPGSNDFINVVLTDEGRLIEPMKRIRARFPFACTLRYVRDLQSPKANQPNGSTSPLDDPKTLVAKFMEFTRGTPPTDIEISLIEAAIANAVAVENSAA
jgi:exonuclease SbcD